MRRAVVRYDTFSDLGIGVAGKNADISLFKKYFHEYIFQRPYITQLYSVDQKSLSNIPLRL